MWPHGNSGAQVHLAISTDTAEYSADRVIANALGTEFVHVATFTVRD